MCTYGVGHLGYIKLGLGHSHRLAQGSNVEMVLHEALPVQVRHFRLNVYVFVLAHCVEDVRATEA